MRESTIIKIVAILVLFLLEAFAIFRGMDGKLLLTIGAIIGGIVGFHLKEPISNLLK
jgi:small-conductance mechanosensitive channel